MTVGGNVAKAHEVEEPVGVRLRKRRQEMGLTQKEVAEGAGLTIGFISHVERGIAFPSLTSLISICDVLGQHISSFFAQPPGKFPYTRNDQRAVYSLRGDFETGKALRYERLSTVFGGNVLSSVIVHEPPGYRGEPIEHEGEEMFFVLNGEITVEVEGERILLQAGDSFHFASTRRHASWNHTDSEASFLHVCTMDVFGDKDWPATHPSNLVGHYKPQENKKKPTRGKKP